MNSPPLAKAPADRPSSTVAGGVTVDSNLLCNNKEFMELFISKESSGNVKQQRLKEFLQQFVVLLSEGAEWKQCSLSSDPHSVASLLVQRLLSRFSDAFVVTSKSHDQVLGEVGGGGGGGKRSSLREFLCDEINLLLLVSIHLISKQVDTTFPELAELLLVVIKTLLSKSCDFKTNEDSVLNLVPFYKLMEGNPQWTISSLTDEEGGAGVASTSGGGGGGGGGEKGGGGGGGVAGTTGGGRPSRSPKTGRGNRNKPHPSPKLYGKGSHLPKDPLPSIVPASEITQIVKKVVERKSGATFDYKDISERELYMLLFSVLESVSTIQETRGTCKIASTIHLLQSVTALFEDIVVYWFQFHNKDTSSLSSSASGGVAGGGITRSKDDKIFGRRTPSSTNEPAGFDKGDIGYNGSLHLARIILRIWMSLSSQVIHSSLHDSHLSEVQPLLFSPLATVCKACSNLQAHGVFKGDDSLDHEFTLIILEGFFSGLYAVNIYPNVPTCQVSNFYEALRDTLTDSCQEWFAYLCSKLHGVSGSHPIFQQQQNSVTPSGVEATDSDDRKAPSPPSPPPPPPLSSSSWIPVLSYSYTLLTYILAELLATSAHIKFCQQASKLALVTGGSYKTSRNSPFHRPITYSLEVATGFDKLTFRLSKMAELLLSMFKEVPRVQLLSLQLLSETTKDMIGVIGSFLSSISDPSIYLKPEVLDPYLELLEEIWFRLSPNYNGTTPWWNKLSNYSSLLMGSNYQVVCQVIYHIQCLFSHESSTLKSQLTKKVIVPFHTHLMALVKRKCFKATTIVVAEVEKSGKKNKSSKPAKVSQVVQMGHEEDLEESERNIISLFMKLLVKVVSHPRSLGAFASDGNNLYSLFLLLPLNGFRKAGLRVLEECLFTLHKFGTSNCMSPGSGSTASSPDGTTSGGVFPGGPSGSVAPPPVVVASTANPIPPLARPDETGIQRTLIQILLSMAYSVQIEKIPDRCLSIAERRASLPKYGLVEADEIHKLIQNTFEHRTIKQLLVPGVTRHISVMSDVWELLSKLACSDDYVAELLRQNHIWDIIQVLGPSLANVLSRLHQRQLRESSKDMTELLSLMESGICLLSHLLVLAHVICWSKKEQRSLELYCKEVQNALSLDKGTKILSSDHSHLYVTSLLKSSCCFSPRGLLTTSENSENTEGNDILERTHPQATPTYDVSLSPYLLPPIYSSTPGSLGRSMDNLNVSSQTPQTTDQPTITASGHHHHHQPRPPPHLEAPKMSIPINVGRGHQNRRQRPLRKESQSSSGSYTSPLTAGGGGGIPFLPTSGSALSSYCHLQSTGSMSPFGSWSFWNSSSFEKKAELLDLGQDMMAETTPPSGSLKSWVWVNGIETESSGYDGDIEKDLPNGGLDHREETSLEGGGARGRAPLNSPYPIPTEVKQRIWTTLPLEHCIELLKATLTGTISKNSEKSVEVFLLQFLAMLKADSYNVNLLSGKGYLDRLLDAFKLLFQSRSEGSIACCQLMCHVTEVMAICQISSSETRKLFMRLQGTRVHLAKLPPLLYYISMASSSLSHREPSTYMEFSYNRPSRSLHPQQMLTVPTAMPWSDKPRCVSIWFCVDKYPLQAHVHIFSAFTGRYYFQVWVCACSGDITLRLSSTLLLSFPEDPVVGTSCRTLGSVVHFGHWHHMAVNMLPVPSQALYEVFVVMDGSDQFQYKLAVPPPPQTSYTYPHQYLLAGGAVSPHTSEKHIHLVKAENAKISWRLCSLNVLNGFSKPKQSMGIILHQLGPDCPNSNIQAVYAIAQRCKFGYSEDSDDTSYIRSLLDEKDLRSLIATPIFSYSALYPHKVFLTSYKDDYEMSYIYDLQVILSATIVVKPRILDSILNAVGTDQFIYLYAKVVSEECSEDVQCCCLSLIHLSIEHSITAYLEFEQHGGMALIQQVMRSPQASVGDKTLKTILNWCCGGPELKQVKFTEVLSYILLDWRIWHKAPHGVWEKLLWQLEQLLITPSSGVVSPTSVNWCSFAESDAITKLLITIKERALESLPSLSPSIACMFVRLITCLLGEPLILENLANVCNHLLVSDVNQVRYLSPQGIMDTSLSAFESQQDSAPPPSSASSRGGAPSDSSPPLPSRSNSSLGSSFAQEEPEEVIAFDTMPYKGRMPNSSYCAADTLFTWTDITGQMQETASSDEIPTSIEVGLLGHLRKLVSLMSDLDAKRVIGQVIQHEMLIAIAHNKNIVVRTAVIRVLDEYFRRGGDGVKSNFVQVKGFHLLASQLKRFKVSFDLMSALCGIVVGKAINLKRDPVQFFLIPKSLSMFNMHAVVPVLQCVVSTISQPELFHATFCLLRELFEIVKGMPAFMLNNGLLKVICQVISIATDHTHLSVEEKELALNDTLHMCKLVIIFAISADQEELFNMLENLLVCLRHCSEELLKYKGQHAASVSYLHLYQYLILAQALRYFHEDAQDGEVMVGTGERTRASYIPTLASSTQPPGHADLTNRFITVCSTAVEWVAYGVGPYSSEHAQFLLYNEVTLPSSVSMDVDVNRTRMDVAFIRYLLNFFHKALQPTVKKGGTLGSMSNRQRYSMTSRPHLIDQLSRLLGHMISPIHDRKMQYAAMKELWGLKDFKFILNQILTSPLKKLIGPRLILTIIRLASTESSIVNADLLKDFFDVVVRSGTITRLRNTTRLETLLSYEDEKDAKKKHKYESIVEEMRSSDQRWLERCDFDLKGFSQRLKELYSRLVEKAHSRQQSINRTSTSVTDMIFHQQSIVKQKFLDQISLAGRHERDSLRCWRKLILHNTHPRALWSKDEHREMCWQLDPTEGPGRVRRRMIRVPRTVDEKHFLPEALNQSESKNDSSPLSFIFEHTAYNGMDGMWKKIVTQSGEALMNNSLPWSCLNISPDSCCKGHLVMSNRCCYFVGDEPLDDPNITKLLPSDEETTLLTWEHSEVVEIHHRRYMLKNNALEIFLVSGKTLLLAFDTTEDRNYVHQSLLQLDVPNLVDSGEADTNRLKQVSISWKQGEINNFEYLMELNKLSGRTFNDLMQYPVFPFILANYHEESKKLDLRAVDSFRKLDLPISIQDDSKRRKYLDTYQFLETEARTDSSAPGLSNHASKPYHYGSHYSNSGIVLHFLVRVPPFTSMFLSFQGQNFDIADRTFRNMATTWWLSSSESATDVKELIPEFFYLPEFLRNKERFQFGECQDGSKVDHVDLPGWANDARDFILKHRQALESDYVSRNLHHWIDLVFGYKQTGKAAEQAVNVFHPATYYGGLDIDSVVDPTQQAAMRTMVKTYGQMPAQLFNEPHPQRTNIAPVLTTFRMRLGNVLKRLTSTSPLFKVTHPLFWSRVSIHRVKINTSSQDCDFIGATGSPDLLFAHSSRNDRIPESMVCIGSRELVVMGKEAHFVQNTSPAHSSLLMLWNNWDNSLIVLSTTQESQVHLHSHPSNKITCAECVKNGQMIVSGGSGGVVSFWSILNTVQVLQYVGTVTHLRGHSGPIICMAACKPFSIVVTGSTDKTAIIWDTNRLCYVNSLSHHDGPVSVIATSPTLGDIATAFTTKSQKHNKGTNSTLQVWTINGTLVKKILVEGQITCLAYSAAPEGVYVNILAGGLANGNIKLWSSWDLTLIRELECPLEDSTPVLSLTISSCSKELYAGFSNRQVVAWIKPKQDFTSEEIEFEHIKMENYLHGRI